MHLSIPAGYSKLKLIIKCKEYPAMTTMQFLNEDALFQWKIVQKNYKVDLR
jgi:hypothetical protein